ncbi:MAG TPA: glycosyltransferase family 2 protein, partial [Actinomycetota bacterium]
MIFLRILGLIVAVALLTSVVRRRRRGALALPDTLIYAILSLGLAVLAIVPAVAAPLLNVMGFKAGDKRRVIGVLFISNIITYVLILRSFAKTDRVMALLGDYADRLAARHFGWEFTAERDLGSAPGKLCVVIPALNEEQALPEVLTEIPREVEGLEVEVIVVSDGSTDATEEVARRHGALVVGRDLRRGQGAAVALGYRVAISRGASVVATLDADGQYDPLE